MSDKAAMPGLRAWLDIALVGNLRAEEWVIETLKDEPVAFNGSVQYSGQWQDSRERASVSLSNPHVAQQHAEALRHGSPVASLIDEVKSDPNDWLYNFTEHPLKDWCFAHTAVEDCDTCRKAGTVQCTPCNGSGQTRCGRCCGSGRDSQSCGGCGGSGRSARVRQVRFVNGSIIDTRNETYYVACLACGGGGRKDVTCGSCGGRGSVACSKCSGKGRLRCDDCSGAGRREYRYDRCFVVTASTSLAIAGALPWTCVEPTLLRAWKTLASKGDGCLSDVMASEPSDEGVEFTFSAAPQLALANVSALGTKARAWSYGSTEPVCDAEPVLARALKLDKDLSKDGWSDLAYEIAGRRILSDTTRIFDAQKGALEARRAATAKAMLEKYGPLLSEAGAQAIASTAAFGVGALRSRARRSVWTLNIGVSALGGLLVALAIVALVSQSSGREPQYAALSTPSTLFCYALFVALLWTTAGCFLARHKVKAVGRALGLTEDITNREGRRGMLWPLGSLVAFLIVALGAPLLGYSIRMPTVFRTAFDNALHPPVLPVIVTSQTINLRASPSERAAILRKLSPGMQMRVLEDDNGQGWTKVRWNTGYGFVASRFVRPVPADAVNIP